MWRAEVTEGKSGQLLAKVDAWIASNGSNGFAVGSELTMADIVVFVYACNLSSGFFDGVPKEAIEKHQNIQAVVKTVGAIDQVKAWYTKREAEGGKEAYHIGRAK